MALAVGVRIMVQVVPREYAIFLQLDVVPHLDRVVPERSKRRRKTLKRGSNRSCSMGF